MNAERIALVADTIEAGQEGLVFDMAFWWLKSSCGTFACIAGWTAWLASGQSVERYDGQVRMHEAAKWLGLDAEQAERLFVLDNLHISQSQAVATLRHLAATGEIDWEATDAANPAA